MAAFAAAAVGNLLFLALRFSPWMRRVLGEGGRVASLLAEVRGLETAAVVTSLLGSARGGLTEQAVSSSRGTPPISASFLRRSTSRASSSLPRRLVLPGRLRLLPAGRGSNSSRRAGGGGRRR